MGTAKKEYLPLPDSSLTVLGSAVTAFASCPRIGPIVITVPPDDEDSARACLPAELLQNRKDIFFVDGGASRRLSVHNALLFLEPLAPSHVLIHDGARPWISLDLIERCIDSAFCHGAVIPALPLLETPKEIRLDKLISLELSSSEVDSESVFINRHLRRESIYVSQTPQAFKFPEILIAHNKSAEREAAEGFEYTDDAEVWGEFAGQVAVISGDANNKKITYPEDIR